MIWQAGACHNCLSISPYAGPSELNEKLQLQRSITLHTRIRLIQMRAQTEALEIYYLIRNITPLPEWRAPASRPKHYKT